jgi:hypothetical protein
MYFPKSQIKTNLYTKGGEFQNAFTQEEYMGSYFETSTGDFYTGKNPSDKPNSRLVKITDPTNNNIETSLNELPEQTTKYSEFTFDYIVSPIRKTIEPSIPNRIFPLLNESDYKLGEFQRYFLSKTNEPMFIEINKEQYQKYINRDETVAYQLYQPLTLPWQIAGDRNQVYNTNKNIVEKTERDNRLRGFKSYFKERYDQFYK